MTTGKTIDLTRRTFVGKVIVGFKTLNFELQNNISFYGFIIIYLGVSQVAQWVKSPSAMQEMQETRVRSWVGKIPWRGQWHPTPVFLPGKSHGSKSLVDCSPWGLKESDTVQVILQGIIYLTFPLEGRL